MHNESTADICHCRHPRHYHRNRSEGCIVPGCDCREFHPVGNPSSDGLGIVHRPLHGQGRRFYVVLGTQGFYILDSEEQAADGSPKLAGGVYASKSRSRELCDGLNEGAGR